ncbi:hypothetical protein [Qipengyuania qiaonensis]|uniref:DUF4175 domain-containing protein n=1 Tax=Qipengyuania qiaonensis TaxID=2867240 RepID=A0ABS7J6B8_9SPHN|nr:hypothetical protein [Qipengyuania qiaonensis]MBX7482463.1 hypothetical protein [Qipengyuania qiaonensis]
MSHRVRPQSAIRIFAWPIAIGVAALIGLVLGLTGDGARDLAAWILLGIGPVVVIAALLGRTS